MILGGDNQDRTGRSLIERQTAAAEGPQQIMTPAAISAMAVVCMGTMMRTWSE